MVFITKIHLQDACFSVSSFLISFWESRGQEEINFPSQICIFSVRKKFHLLYNGIKIFFPICRYLKEQTLPLSPSITWGAIRLGLCLSTVVLRRSGSCMASGSWWGW